MARHNTSNKVVVSTSESLREVVEQALDSEDITPLVRLVFDAHHGDALPKAVPQDSESGTTTLDDVGALLRENPLEAVMEALQEVAEDKEAEIAQICRSNALEISSALHDMSAMQGQVSSLRSRLGSSNSSLQAAGQSLLTQVEGVAEISRVQQGVADTRQVLGVAVRVLTLCARAGRYIESRQLYKAYRVLESIHQEHGGLLREGLESRSLPLDHQGGASPARPVAQTPQRAAATAAAPGLGSLGPFLRDLVADLTQALEAQAVGDFNQWLGTVRAQARIIGLRAIRWAAAERQREEALARQRRGLVARWAATGGAESGSEMAGALLAVGCSGGSPTTPMTLPRGQSAAQSDHLAHSSGKGAGGAASSPRMISGGTPGRDGVSSSGGATPSPSPSPSSPSPPRSSRWRAAAGGVQPSVAEPPQPPQPSSPGTMASAVKGRREVRAGSPPPASPDGPEPAPGGSTGDLLEGVDMTPLLRCLHIHACLRRTAALRQYYMDNRRLQLDADLALAGPFLEGYQVYITQIVGYFLVEERVQRCMGGGVQGGDGGTEGFDIAAQVAAAWDRAVGRIREVLEGAFQGASSAAAMLAVKDFMLLACCVLERCGFHAVTIREILMNGRGRYHELLAASTGEAVQAVLSQDLGSEPLEVVAGDRTWECFTLLGLPATFHSEDAGNKRPPFRAPFTPMVPLLVRTIRGYIADSVGYLKGLVSVGEVVPASKQYRDRMLARVVGGQLMRRVEACGRDGGGGSALKRRLQLVADVAAVMHALSPLDDFAMVQARGEDPATAPQSPPPRCPSPRSRHPPPGSNPPGSNPPGSNPPGSNPPAATDAAGGAAAGGDTRGVEGGSGSPSRSPSPCRSPSRRQRSRLSMEAGVRQQLSPRQGGTAGAAGAAEQDAPTSAFSAAGWQVVGGTPMAPAAIPGAGAAGALQGVLESAEALVVQVMSQRVLSLLAAGEKLDWVPDQPHRSLEGGYSPHMEEIILYLKECFSQMNRATPDPSAARVIRRVFSHLADAVMQQLLSDAVPAFNMFGLQRLMSDLGGLSRCAGSMRVAGLEEALQEPQLFCEMMVFGSLEEVVQPEAREGKYAAVDLRRLALVLERYRELERGSGFAGMHKSRQSERFISRKTVDAVVRQLREATGMGRKGSRISTRTSTERPA